MVEIGVKTYPTCNSRLLQGTHCQQVSHTGLVTSNKGLVSDEVALDKFLMLQMVLGSGGNHILIRRSQAES